MRIVMTISMVFCFFLNLASAEDVSETDWMPDAELRSAVREELGLGDDEALTQADMTDLTYLKSVRGTLSDLTGLEHATNLTQLLLYNNNISDITPLNGLTSIEILKLGNNPLSSISTLASLTNVRFLTVQNCGLTDVNPIPDLFFITDLRIQNNALTNAHLLSALPALITIDIPIPVPPAVESGSGSGVGVSVSRVGSGVQSPSLPIEITVVFDAPVSGFVESEFISGYFVPDDHLALRGIDGAYISGSDSSRQDEGIYSISIFPNGSGKLDIQVPAGVAADSDGNSNRASNTVSVLVTDDDRFLAPSVRISTTTRTINTFENFRIVVFFSEPVKRFTIEDLVATGTGEFGGWVETVGPEKRAYILSVFGMDPGALTFRIRENAAIDYQGHWTPVSVQWNPTVTFTEAEED